MIMKISILTFVYIGLLVPALPAAEHPAMQANIYSPAKIEWKEGMFVMRIRVPNGYHIPAHTHPKPERVTIIQGTFKLAMGENPKVADAQILPVGTFGVWPAGMVHAVWIEGETIVQFHGMGPWIINYVNPADDPRNKSGVRK